MHPKKAHGIVTKIMDRLDSVLAPYGFVRDLNKKRTYYDSRSVNWVRDRDWKSDVIGMSYPLRYSPIMYPGRIILNAQVFMSCPDEPLWLDGIGVESIVKRWNGYTIPTGFYNFFFPNRLRNIMIRDTVKSLPWFEQFEAPQQCLTRLTSGETNWGAVKGNSVKSLTDYLSELIDSQEVN